MQPPLLCPRSIHLYPSPHAGPQFIERNGAVVALPSDHRLPLAHYLLHQPELNHLKRWALCVVCVCVCVCSVCCVGKCVCESACMNNELADKARATMLYVNSL